MQLKSLLLCVLIATMISCSGRQSPDKVPNGADQAEDSSALSQDDNAYDKVHALLVSPKNPEPGKAFRILSTGGSSIRKARIEVSGPMGELKAQNTRNGNGLPYWRIDGFTAGTPGNYQVFLTDRDGATNTMEFTVADGKPAKSPSGSIWTSPEGWTSETELLYSAWINALFYEADERSSWTALDAVMQNGDRNFLYNHLGLREDDPEANPHVIMEPDCADNPFYLRAYFAWKLGLPFGFHESDRGWLGKAPTTGRWITNATTTSKSNPVLSFNAFLRRVMDGVHSGTARTALKAENSDYYPVELTRESLRPGVVFADPYGHTLILVRWIPQTGKKPGMLLSVDAQPDGTVAIKRFWKGNFLFTTTEVIGDPGFKAFRPIVLTNGHQELLNNTQLGSGTGFIPFSMQQQGLGGDEFYHTMDRAINPKPLDPETALLDLIQALHEQLVVRVNSVSNGEAYMTAHPGEVIPMPGRPAGVFQAGGQWEDFSTPNRDLRLLIAMDAVTGFPEKIVSSPGDYKLPLLSSPEQVKQKLESLLATKTNQLSITYQRSDRKEQILTLAAILNRKEAFEMAYNPNDCIEIRWGAPENSEERSACKRHVPPGQLQKMKEVRTWFQKRLHPPT